MVASGNYLHNCHLSLIIGGVAGYATTCLALLAVVCCTQQYLRAAASLVFVVPSQSSHSNHTYTTVELPIRLASESVCGCLATPNTTNHFELHGVFPATQEAVSVLALAHQEHKQSLLPQPGRTKNHFHKVEEFQAI